MLKRVIRRGLNRYGYTVTRKPNGHVPPPPPFTGLIEEDFQRILDQCLPHTQTTPLAMYNFHAAVRHVVRKDIPGDIVECGVWRGGSAMVAALTLLGLGDETRMLYLYDTYEGMPEGGEKDVTYDGREVDAVKSRYLDPEHWNYAPIELVRENLASSGFPAERLRLVKGRVEDTMPAVLPERVAIVRHDTDFYESTRHELEQLFPRLSRGGIIIVDDYDYWSGARTAADEFFAREAPNLFLARLDVGRIGVKR